MFDVWICKEAPTLRLVVTAGGSLPADLGQRNWKLVGPLTPAEPVAADVEKHGFAFFHSDEPVPDPDSLKNSNGSGA